MPQERGEHAHATDREPGSTHAELNTPRGSKRLRLEVRKAPRNKAEETLDDKGLKE